MTRIIALANQKGGTGKTTTAVNLVAGLARMQNQRVLFVDLDPQANASAVFFGPAYVAGPDPGPTVYDILTEKSDVLEVLRSLTLEGDPKNNVPEVSLDMIPAHIKLAVAEQELISVFQREDRLIRALRKIKDNYDIVILDCPPSLGLLTINGLMGATEVLIPVEPGIFPLIGLGLLRQTIGTVQSANQDLEILGVLPVRVGRTNLANTTISELSNAFGDRVFSPIPERVAIGEAHARGKDIFSYDAISDGAKAYATLAQEVMDRG